MKRLVVLGLVLLIMPEGSELRANENKAKLGIDENLQELLNSEEHDVVDHLKIARSNHVPAFMRNIIRKRRDSSAHHGHVYNSILHEIHRGHVTQEKISHWYKEVQDALHEGEMTMDDVNKLIAALKTTSGEHGESCCWFG